MKRNVDSEGRLVITLTKADANRVIGLLSVYKGFFGDENADVNLLYDYLRKYIEGK